MLAKMRLPGQAGGRHWTVEFAPLYRLQGRHVQERKAGARIGQVGHVAPTVGEARLVRVRHVPDIGKAHSLRSSPAN